jgi:hypothetical protein
VLGPVLGPVPHYRHQLTLMDSHFTFPLGMVLVSIVEQAVVVLLSLY